MARHAAAFLAYTALTVALTWPLVFQLGAVVPHDLGDPLLSTWTLWWNASVLPLTDRWWNGPIFFPAPDALTLSDHRIGIGIISTPAIWLGASPLAAYNLAFLASFVLSAIGGYALGFVLTGHHGAAFLGGLVFGFNPFRAGHLPHLELLCSYWLPFALLALHRWGETKRPIWLVALSVALTMQALTSVYYFAFFGVIVGLWLIWFVRLVPWKRDGLHKSRSGAPGSQGATTEHIRHIRGRSNAARRDDPPGNHVTNHVSRALSLQPREYLALGASLAAPLVIIAPILLRYRRAHASMGLSRTIDEIESFSADLVGLVTTPQMLALWNTPLSWDRAEGALYPGVVAVALVIAGLIVAVPPPAPVWPSWGRRLRDALLAGAAIAAVAALIPVVWGPVGTELLGLRISVSQSFKPISVAVLLVAGWLLTTARIRREWRASSALAFFALTTIAMWLFALGPTGHVMGERFLYKAPYSWLMLLPGVDTAFRVPARFGMLAALTLCAATALAWAALTQGRSRRWTAVATAVAALAITADSWTKPLPMPAAPPALVMPSNVPSDAVVLELPLGTFEDAAAMYRAIDHRRATVNGLSGYAPPSYQILHSALGEGHVGVLDGLASVAPLIVFVDRRAAGDHLTSQMRALRSATLLRQDATYDVLLMPHAPTAPAIRADLASGLTMQAGRASLAGDQLPLMSDGDRHTAWMTPTQRHTEEFIADLGRARDVHGIVLGLGAFSGGFPRTLSVLTSINETEWEHAWTGDVAARALQTAVRDQQEVAITLPFAVRAARYIRVRQVGWSTLPWAVAEFRALVH